MFGPNKSRKIDLHIGYHHRSEEFVSVYRDVVHLFKELFHIPKNYEVLIYTGSGTLAIEAFTSHVKGKLSVSAEDISKDKFAKRWRAIATHYGKYDPSAPATLVVQFETSHSKLNPIEGATFVDAVSSFPFFDTPTSPVWSTVSSKMLGGLPVLGILVIDKTFLETKMLNDSPSYLNPYTHREYQKNGQTPFTPAIPLFVDFYNQLLSFDLDTLRDTIQSNYRLLEDVIGKENIINPGMSPAITLKPGVISEHLAKKWKLYGYLSKEKPQPIQIFLYSEEPELYKQLAKDIADERKK